MRAIAAGVTDVGRERDHNEDRFVLLPEFEVYVVADGMGGHQCGEVASQMATSTIATYFRERGGDRGDGVVADVLRASLMSANERIHHRAMTSTAHQGMGTTVVAAAFNAEDEKLYVAHAGDSRCYRLRDGVFEQVTRDHSLVEEALRTRPDITESELAYLPSNVITRALGVEPMVDVEVTVDRVVIGDVFLLCSDGLHGFVTDERIGEILRETDVLTNACTALVAEANANGGGDNVTAVLVRIEELALPLALTSSVPAPPGPEAEAAAPGGASGAQADWSGIVDEDTMDAESLGIGLHDDTPDASAVNGGEGDAVDNREGDRDEADVIEAADAVDGEGLGETGAALGPGVIVNVAAATPDVVARIATSDDQEAARALIEVEDTGRLPAITDAEAILRAEAEGLPTGDAAQLDEADEADERDERDED